MKTAWKKWACVLLALTMTAALLTGCGGKAPAESVPEESGSAAESTPVSSDASGEDAGISQSGGDSERYSYSAGLTEQGFFEGVTALDHVTLPAFGEIRIPAGTGDVTEEELEKKINSLLYQYNQTEQVTDRAVKDGDTVNIDYVGSVDGVEFTGGSTGGAGTEVTIGVTSYIDDFLEQLIGHMPGDTFDVNVTFPVPYENNEDLAGKDAVFVTTVNYIVDDKYTEADDTFVKDNLREIFGWSTAAEMKEGLREKLSLKAKGDYLWSQVQEKAEIKAVPDGVYDYHVRSLKNYYSVMANQYGAVLEEFLQQVAQVSTLDEAVEKEEAKELLQENAVNSLLLQAMAEQLNYTVSDEELDAYLKENVTQEDRTSLEAIYGKAYLRLIVRENLVKDKMAAGW